jgi:hypothetical protein
MSRRMAWRLLALTVASLTLAACTQEGPNPIVRAGVGEVVARVRGAPPPAPEAAAPRVLTRADIEATGTAAIRGRLFGTGGTGALFYGTVENGGVVSYVTQLRETIGLRGSQIASTRGLGTDLLRATSSPDDPLVRPVPPGQWPAQVERAYEFPGEGARGVVERFSCSFSFGEVRTIAILTRQHRGVEVSETCAGPAGSFENLHFADLETGFVWRSIQWTGPRQGPVDIEVIVPRL